MKLRMTRSVEDLENELSNTQELIKELQQELKERDQELRELEVEQAKKEEKKEEKEAKKDPDFTLPPWKDETTRLRSLLRSREAELHDAKRKVEYYRERYESLTNGFSFSHNLANPIEDRINSDHYLYVFGRFIEALKTYKPHSLHLNCLDDFLVNLDPHLKNQCQKLYNMYLGQKE